MKCSFAEVERHFGIWNRFDDVADIASIADFGGFNKLASGPVITGANAGPAKSNADVNVRKLFPESWLWSQITTGL